MSGPFSFLSRRLRLSLAGGLVLVLGLALSVVIDRIGAPDDSGGASGVAGL